jgi:hypothetical protein
VVEAAPVERVLTMLAVALLLATSAAIVEACSGEASALAIPPLPGVTVADTLPPDGRPVPASLDEGTLLGAWSLVAKSLLQVSSE